MRKFQKGKEERENNKETENGVKNGDNRSARSLLMFMVGVKLKRER